MSNTEPGPSPAPTPPRATAHHPIDRTLSGSSSFTSIREKVARALSPNRDSGESSREGRRPSWGASMSFGEERGRQPSHVVSTGRGGAGNLVPHAASDAEMAPGAERGREFSPHPAKEIITHSGRGGAGNIRDPSRSRTRVDTKTEANEEALQEKLISDARGRQAESAFSTGRGGVGNISRSRSRSKARAEGKKESRREGSALGLGRKSTPDVVHSGRGGFGNISEERSSTDTQTTISKAEADIVAKHDAQNHAYATGKGGAGNIHTPSGEPEINGLSLEDKEVRDAHKKMGDKDHWVPAGRGGAGNMHRASTDQSPAGEERGRDHDAHKGGMINNVLRSLSRATGREKSNDRARD